MDKSYTIRLEGENVVINQGSQQVVIVKEAAKDLVEFVLKLPLSYWEGVQISGDNLSGFTDDDLRKAVGPVFE